MKHFFEKLQCCWYILTSRSHFCLTMRKNIFKKTDHGFITNLNKLHNFVDFDDSIVLVKDNKTKVSLEDFALDIIISYCKNKIETGSYDYTPKNKAGY